MYVLCTRKLSQTVGMYVCMYLEVEKHVPATCWHRIASLDRARDRSRLTGQGTTEHGESFWKVSIVTDQ